MKLNCFLLLVIISLAISCGDNCVEGNGNRINQEIIVQDFNDIVNSTLVDVELAQNSAINVLFSVEESLASVFDFTTVNGALEIDSEENCLRTSMSNLAQITLPELTNFTNSGSGDLLGTTTLSNPTFTNSGW